MATSNPQKKLSTAMIFKTFFGVKKGQTLQEFAKELKALTDQDRQEMAQGIEDGTLTY